MEWLAGFDSNIWSMEVVVVVRVGVLEPLKAIVIIIIY